MVTAKFAIGQLITHSLYGYRGVIIDADPEFCLSDDWYERMAKSRPPKHQPWYHVLVNNSSIQTYVSEYNLKADVSTHAIKHPLVDTFFQRFQQGQYQLDEPMN